MWPFKEKIKQFKEIFLVKIDFGLRTLSREFETLNEAKRELSRIKKNLNTKGKPMISLIKDWEIINRGFIMTVYIEKERREIIK